MSNKTKQKARVKGECLHIDILGNNVKAWVASPTGDSTDSLIFDIPCLDSVQAEFVANIWKDAWELNENNEEEDSSSE